MIFVSCYPGKEGKKKMNPTGVTYRECPETGSELTASVMVTSVWFHFYTVGRQVYMVK